MTIKNYLSAFTVVFTISCFSQDLDGVAKKDIEIPPVNLDDRIKNEIKDVDNEFYVPRILKYLETGDYYNISVSLASIEADSSLVYESLKKAYYDDDNKTCETLLTIEYHIKKLGWSPKIYELNKEKFASFCDNCRATMTEPFDPSLGESKKRNSFEINPSSRSLYELAIIVKTRDAMVRKLEDNNDLMLTVDQENFILIEYILDNIETIDKEKRGEILSQMQIAMHHQPDVDKRDKYKNALKECDCISMSFMNSLYQDRTDRIRYTQKQNRN